MGDDILFPGTNIYNRYTNMIIKIIKSINLPLLIWQSLKNRVTISTKGAGDFCSKVKILALNL